MEKQPDKQTVFPLSQFTLKTQKESMPPGMGTGKSKHYGKVANAQITGAVSQFMKAAHKAAQHGNSGKGEGNMHIQILWLAEDSHTKACQPSVRLLERKQCLILNVQFHGHGKQIPLGKTVKLCMGILLRRQEPVCAVYSDFSAGINAVLSFPEFDQPCLAVIIKIDRLAVKHHMEMRRCPVIQFPVAEVILPGVFGSDKNIFANIIGKAKGADLFI